MLDADGRPRRFSTTDRWAALPECLVRAQWLTPVIGWQAVDGRPVPTGGDAGFHAKTSHVGSSTARGRRVGEGA
ncbi:MAG: DUF6544 family protein [Pseudonocardiaceae bacterium]